MTTFTATFDLRDEVLMDGREEVTGIVTGLMFAMAGEEVPVAGWHNGQLHRAWFAPQRLTLKPERIRL